MESPPSSPLSPAAVSEIETALRARYEREAFPSALPRGVEPVLTVVPAAASPGLRAAYRQRTERMLLPSPLLRQVMSNGLVAPAASPELVPKPSKSLPRGDHTSAHVNDARLMCGRFVRPDVQRCHP